MSAREAGPLERVVVGVDGSDLAEVALGWAARRLPAGGALHVVHAVRPGAELAAAAAQVDWVEARHHVRADLEGRWTDSARRAGVEPVTHLIDDDPGRALLAVAAREQATAIVVGVHGIGDRHLPLLGSVTRRLLHRSTIPVVVVNNPAPNNPAPNSPGPERAASNNPVPETATGPSARPDGPSGAGAVMAGVGYGEASDQAVAWAAAYAAARSLHLELVHAVANRPIAPLDSPTDALASYLGADVDLAWAAEDLESVRDEVLDRYPELVVITRVERGSAVAALTPRDAPRPEVVVAGKRHGRALTRLTISPRLRRLIVGATCPTVIVPSTAGGAGGDSSR